MASDKFSPHSAKIRAALSLRSGSIRDLISVVLLTGSVAPDMGTFLQCSYIVGMVS